MERHQHVVVIFFPIWSRFGYMFLTNRSFSQQAWWFSVGNVPPLGTKRYPLALIAFKFLSRVNIEQHACCVNFCDFSGFVWTCLCINWIFHEFYVHNSNLNYMHMLQCIWIGWKIKSVSLGACLGPMQEMGMNFKNRGTVDCRQNIEMPGFLILVNPKLVWNSWNLACYHGAASTCCGTNFVPFGAGLGICFSQTGASHNKHDGFR